MSRLSIVHWNDAYRVTPQKIFPNGDTIDVTQFAALLDDIRGNWGLRSDGARDGLLLFSGDLFSPSVESTVTRGSHMVPVMNELAPDVALTGNHDFDFGYPHLSKLVDDTKFPWLLSNIVDENTNNVPEHLYLFKVLERSGVRVGIIGLVEEDWITTVSAWPPNFMFKDMAKTGREMSQRLRGEHQCDIVIALTHARVPNDIKLAKDLLALSPSAQKARPIAGEHGVDIILGGHDHLYFVSKGVTAWEGYDVSKPSIGSQEDNGDILVVKSGTDFRELSELTLELEDTPLGSVRKKMIKAIHGKRHQIRPGMPSSEKLQKILHDVLSSVSQSLKEPVCITDVELDLRSHLLRTDEMAAGNWFADVLRHAYDDALCTKCGSGSDGVLISAGTLRGDSVYPPGVITLGNILEILPFDDPTVVLELDGESLWDALEEGLSKYPAQEGRFPVVSGFRVSWDSRRPPGQRVLEVCLLQEAPSTPSESSGQSPGSETPVLVDGEFIKREKNGRTYKIVTREYLASGHDGYATLPGHTYLVDDEDGQLMSSLVRKYLLGAHYVNKMVRLREKEEKIDHLHSETAEVVGREIEHRERRSRMHYQDHFNITAREHMSCVDCYDGTKVRRGNDGKNGHEKTYKGDLLVIHPVVDGRFKDVARS
ncbi:Metallo-dependent phosphatase-like protein [Boletus edulis BED1]|uniref:Metallo-dependent phosphatase-like protein n=1 Tax=Boletus edulis BED1 TaxID=1328754 RepID=A0AAD4BJI1_BOLED|nr:Metallo-dependent phosphatase-like protein [Boletus edulis BED1]